VGLPENEMRGALKRLAREAREVDLADATEEASASLGSTLYPVIYADPPWRFQPYSRTTGMDRAADNHYPTLTTDAICQIVPPAGPDCALFLWATAPMMLDALDVMEAWGFEYRAQWVWVKRRAGTGYWSRNRHELLLLGIKGEVPAPAMGEQYDSVLELDAGPHSAKPAAFAEMIEAMFPNCRLLEMFARGPRVGWDVWGNESSGKAD
jgi:N6-adenosine-specific RNA methylase IME4